MSNLTDARQSIKDELDQARQGQAYYQSRVTSLEGALEALEQIQPIGDAEKAMETASRTRGRGKGTKALANSATVPAIPATQSVPVKAGARQKAQGRDTTLPSTGKDFWPNLIKEQPQSARDVLAAAIKSFGFEPDRDQKQKLVQRMTAALNTMVKAGVIQDSGRGRERRFFKGTSKA